MYECMYVCMYLFIYIYVTDKPFYAHELVNNVTKKIKVKNYTKQFNLRKS